MAAQDPLRQFFSMAEDARRNIDSMISQGTRQMQSALPQLPFPGATRGMPLELPRGPEQLLANLPKLPNLPMQGTRATRSGSSPIAPPETPLTDEGTSRAMQRQGRPLDSRGIGRRF